MMMSWPIALLILVGLVVVYLWWLYNRLVAGRLRVSEAWSQIDVQLKRRADLIPNLVETVKGYAKHEKTVLENVTRARSALLAATSLAEKSAANNQLAKALKSIFALSEAYPQLRASENFKSLQEELTDTEDKVSYSRQFYNKVVMDFNTSLQVFPNVLVAGTLGFKPAEFFEEVTPAERQAIKVRI